MLSEIFNIKNRVEYQIIISKITKVLNELKAKNRDTITIIVSELATNILKYANNGKIKFEINNDIVKIIAIDKGPGIKDIDLALKEGFTSGKSLGLGLSSVKRLSHKMNIETSEKGTKIIVKLKLEK